MLSLMGSEYAGTFAQGADAIQRGQDSRADEFGAILHALHGTAESIIHFESNYFVLFRIGHRLAGQTTMIYYIVIRAMAPTRGNGDEG